MTLTARFIGLLLVAAAASVGGCSRQAADSQTAESGLALVPLTVSQGNRVHRFTVEVAASPSEQERGLMMRTTLAPDRGMIFPFNPPKFASFWMKDTLIPLDLIFIRADGTIDHIAENAVPESLEPIVSGGEVAAVLEVAGGTAARLGIDESATVRWEKP